MRIVFVISSLLRGGAETQLIALSRELARRGHAVALYTLNRNNPRASELDGSGVQIIDDQKRMKFDLAVILRLRRFIRTFGADVVHGFLFDGDLYSRVAAIGTGIPALNSERNDNYRFNLNQRIAHHFSRFLAVGVVANSHSGARFARKMFGLPDKHVHVVWNGIDLERLHSRIAQNRGMSVHALVGRNCKIACLVGTIKPQKDFLLALRVAEQLTNKHPDWCVLFVGDALSNTGEYKQRVMAAFHSAKLNGRAFFTGIRDDVPEIMKQCQVVFSTSHHEGFPNVVLEAMAVGVPVVSTEYSDIRRILPNSWQVIDSRDASQLVEAILRADRERESVVVAQSKWVEQNATIQVAASNLEKVYACYIAGTLQGRVGK